jgi:hypothetical protein
VQDAKAVDAVLQAPGEILDRILALLARVGIDIAPLWLQVFLLLLVAALLVPAIKKLKARKKAERTPWIVIAALALVELGVVIGLVENTTTPGRVGGTLQSERLTDMRLTLLDFRDREISTDSGRPDTTTGRFALHYSPLVDGRARKLRVIATKCKPQDFELARPQLRAQTELTWSHKCEPV